MYLAIYYENTTTITTTIYTDMIPIMSTLIIWKTGMIKVLCIFIRKMKENFLSE